jgi:ABC-type spermidine/putrescine transport system permease subunit I
MMRKFFGYSIYVVVFVIIFFLPVIPIEIEAVVPPPLSNSQRGFASMQDLFGLSASPRVGVVLRAQWYSFIAIVGALVAGYLIAAYVSKRMFSNKTS